MAINNSLLIHQFKRKNFEYNAADYMTAAGTYDREKLLRDARKVAKANNQRLLRLERAGMTNSPAYQGAVKALSGVYDKAGSVPFGKVDPQGRPRYKENVKGLSNEELRRLLYAASKTSKAKTSTVGGVKKIYEQGTKNLQNMLGQLGKTNLTINDLMTLFRDQAFQELTKQFGYSAVLQAVNEKDPEQLILERQEAIRNGDIDVGDDPYADLTPEEYRSKMISDQIADIVNKWGENPQNILEFRKKLGLDTPTLDPTKWIPSV